MFNKEGSCCIVDHCVQRIWVKSQRVVVVKTVDVHFSQVHLVVGVDGGRVEEVTCPWWNQVWEQTGNPHLKHMGIKSDRQHDKKQNKDFLIWGIVGLLPSTMCSLFFQKQIYNTVFCYETCKLCTSAERKGSFQSNVAVKLFWCCATCASRISTYLSQSKKNI